MEQELIIRNQDLLLKGTLFKPDTDQPSPLVIAAHTSNHAARDFTVYRHLAALLPAHGFAVFLFDRRGSGESTGDFETASFYDLASDIQAVVDHLKLKEDIDPHKIGVWGMSQGGWIGPLAAARSKDIAFVIPVSSVGISPAEQMNYSAAFELKERGFSKAEIEQMTELHKLVNQYYRGTAARSIVQEKLEAVRDEAWFPYAYLDDHLPEDPTAEKWYRIMAFDPLPVIQSLHVPVLLLYAEVDPWVPVAQSIQIWKEHGPIDLAVHQIKGANHFMISTAYAGLFGDNGPIAEEYSNILIQWLAKLTA